MLQELITSHHLHLNTKLRAVDISLTPHLDIHQDILPAIPVLATLVLDIRLVINLILMVSIAFSHSRILWPNHRI